MSQFSLVGDVIMALREQAADVPGSLGAPGNIAASGSGSGGSIQLFMKVTQLTPWGESPGSTEITVAGQQVGSTITVTGSCSFAATQLNVYFTLSGSDQEDRFFPFPVQAGGIGQFSISFTLSSPGIAQGFSPNRSSAWLPDTDGSALSAVALYRWINEGLDATTALTEGIRDVTGIPSTAGQAQYQVISNWRKLTSGFYDGYPITMGSKSDIFRRSNVTGISGTTVLNQDSVVQQVELYPQSSRTSGVGTLANAITASSTSLVFTPGATGFVLGFGLALIGPYPADPALNELVYYSSTANNTLSPLTRGMGGTVAQAWPVGTQVSEANIYFSGIRYPLHYAKGQSTMQLQLPPAWIDALRDYLSARYKFAEQDVEGGNALLSSFEKKCQAIKGNREIMSPRQVQVGGNGGVETCMGLGGLFGGVILP